MLKQIYDVVKLFTAFSDTSVISQMDKVILLGDCRVSHGCVSLQQLLLYSVRVKIITVVLALVTRDVTIIIVDEKRSNIFATGLLGCRFAYLTCSVNMRKLTPLLCARACIGIVWTFMDMLISAFSALCAVTVDGKVAAHRCRRADLDMRVSTVRIRTISPEEVHARRHAVWCRCM